VLVDREAEFAALVSIVEDAQPVARPRRTTRTSRLAMTRHRGEVADRSSIATVYRRGRSAPHRRRLPTRRHARAGIRTVWTPGPTATVRDRPLAIVRPRARRANRRRTRTA
jgi:hypothetical protein